MYRILLLLEGIIFLNIPYKEYLIVGIFLSLLAIYFKKFLGFIIYLIVLLWLSNELFIKNIFSLDFIYALVYLIFPSLLSLETILKKDISLNDKTAIFIIPLILYFIDDIFRVLNNFQNLITIVYGIFLIYALYLNFQDELYKINKILILKIMSMVVIPIFIVYLLYIFYPDLLSNPKSQISLIIGFTGIFLLTYKIKHQ
ncbi:hypothetical protein [Methanothermococcus okinawensis]|uniref:Uncharacterized protein n=1 Tax=Methanothermococcus okinawensis (strain DSM 14208 / JCM 11175 / IH1) TaxID=647113 RepID=F8AK10_METOI|nr:hypothetical protein [Methanothermococcus okinawensis]AEH07370.1 hypothetical protein Metok_1405 [Methanothermococcus okinawensis IH1]